MEEKGRGGAEFHAGCREEGGRGRRAKGLFGENWPCSRDHRGRKGRVEAEHISADWLVIERGDERSSRRVSECSVTCECKKEWICFQSSKEEYLPSVCIAGMHL